MKPTVLGDIPLSTFLADYWQKKPLLIRKALPTDISPISADELAGLACEEHVESRLIIQNGEQWNLQIGPFDEKTFAQLPPSHCTLLVQALDHHIPAAAELLEKFNFIPRWRIDDLMMSYANDGGGVGPHYDNYDVFLIQVSGKRQWEVGGDYLDLANQPAAHNKFVANLPVKILSEFTPENTWTLNPGDILYVPPGVGHNGVAQGDDCMTCSVGFRAPSHSEILREYTDYMGEQLTESLRYTDPNLQAQSNTGEISSQALKSIQQILSHYANDETMIGNWFGKHVTTPKYQIADDSELNIEDTEHEDYSLDELEHHLMNGGIIQKNESSRFAYIAGENNDVILSGNDAKPSGTANHILFVDGNQIPTHANNNALVELLGQALMLDKNHVEVTASNMGLLLSLLNHGALYLAEQ
ncbi:cupin domain-containing protein [Pseudomonadales bacterium]|nr:cupin domain-containing protein [Pseudomonadales bacterium]